MIVNARSAIGAQAVAGREVLDVTGVKLLIEGKALPERLRTEMPKPPQPETTEVLKPQPAPGLPGRERPQPA